MDLEDLLARSRVRRSLPEPDTRRAIRRRARLTQADLAKALNVAPGTLSRWESGERTPRGDDRDRYAVLLEALADELGGVE